MRYAARSASARTASRRGAAAQGAWRGALMRCAARTAAVDAVLRLLAVIFALPSAAYPTTAPFERYLSRFCTAIQHDAVTIPRPPNHCRRCPTRRRRLRHRASVTISPAFHGAIGSHATNIFHDAFTIFYQTIAGRTATRRYAVTFTRRRRRRRCRLHICAENPPRHHTRPV